ncbi:MAG: toprim domain-containing protein [Proteobacteria bacterium]|nr:toprim domain-containing protein [Pseudomonadota bacterium]
MSFINFARAHGVEIGDLLSSEKIRRCGTTEKPRSKNGAYFWDGRRGWVFAWDGEARVHWYDDPNAAPWTEAEKQAWRAKRDALRQQADRSHQRAALRAAEMLRATTPGRHDYLIRKRLHDAQGLVLPDGVLLVPMRNLFTNELQGAQLIRWLPEELKWEKKMVPGMKAKGAVLRLGPKQATETILCEGYATGLSIELAARQMRLSASVLVCFSDSNMVHVASLLKTGRRYVFADNDKSGAGERAAKETGLPYCMSPNEGEDANDVHARAGLLPVCSLLMQVRRGEVEAVP